MCNGFPTFLVVFWLPTFALEFFDCGASLKCKAFCSYFSWWLFLLFLWFIKLLSIVLMMNIRIMIKSPTSSDETVIFSYSFSYSVTSTEQSFRAWHLSSRHCQLFCNRVCRWFSGRYSVCFYSVLIAHFSIHYLPTHHSLQYIDAKFCISSTRWSYGNYFLLWCQGSITYSQCSGPWRSKLLCHGHGIQ